MAHILLKKNNKASYKRMGSSVVPEKKESVCLESCIYARYRDHGDIHFTDALRNAEFLRTSVLFYCGSSAHPFFQCRDVKRLVVANLLELLVIKRVTECTKLNKWWHLDPDCNMGWTIKPPNKHTHTWAKCEQHSMVIEEILYHIPHYFWSDEVYHSIQCPCKLVESRMQLSCTSQNSRHRL